MFKYRSPLKRILDEDVDHVETQDEAPVTNLAALRSALSGQAVKAEEKTEQTEQADVEQTDAEFEKILELAADAVSEDTEGETAEAPSEIVADEQPEEDTAPEAEVAVAEAEPEEEEVLAAAAPRRRRKPRVKTTFLGYERSNNGVQSLMESEPTAAASANNAAFPVGWLVVTEGPGRGASITLVEGLMQMGRNDDQAIQLDFGDHGISRENHAVIAYDAESRKCYLGHGGKANLVRLNGGPVLSTVPLSAGDTIRISETTMQFVPFCDDTFDWRAE